jgi:16S rRNA (guanine527-N7)-methyltransferase
MTSEIFLYEDFTKYLGVSRETYARLEDYVELLKKWQSTINLIGAATIADVWLRHIIDSAQLIDKIGPGSAIIDIGSGAGLPGLILAILGIKNITLVESDHRKSAFLREAARVTETEVTIINKRVEDIDLAPYSLITARGFAPLQAIFGVAGGALKPGHKILLLKGKNYNSELRDAETTWSFEHTVFPSVTEKDAVVLLVQNLRKRGAHD